MRFSRISRALGLALALAFLGCGDAVDDDMSKSKEELSKDVADLDVSTLKERLAVVEERAEEIGKVLAKETRPPNESEIKALEKLTDLMGAYRRELAKRK